LRGTKEELVGVVHAAQDRLEQLAHDAECELALQLRAPRAQHLHPRRLGDRPGVGQQGGLAHARRTLDHDERPATVPGPLERRADAGEIVLALQQQAGLHPDAHTATIARAARPAEDGSGERVDPAGRRGSTSPYRQGGIKT
jgi:hypothetical protein